MKGEGRGKDDESTTNHPPLPSSSPPPDGTVRTMFCGGNGAATIFTGDVNSPTSGTGIFGGEKNFVSPHDLPITAMGDARGGTGTVDVVTVSADGRVARIKVFGKDPSRKEGGGWLGWILTVLLMLLAAWAAVLAEDMCKVYDADCAKSVAMKIVKGKGGDVFKLALRKEL